MTTFIFGDYIYETPIFVIKALKKAEIPEALEQMEKLSFNAAKRIERWLSDHPEWLGLPPKPKEPADSGR